MLMQMFSALSSAQSGCCKQEKKMTILADKRANENDHTSSSVENRRDCKTFFSVLLLLKT